MISIAVCEDDSLDCERIKKLLPMVACRLNIEYTLSYYVSGNMLIEAIQEGAEFDLLILDILMEDMDGIQTAFKARALLPQVGIGFVTNSRDYAVDAFEIGAVHYLMKPVSEEGVEAMLMRYIEYKEDEEPAMIFETAQGRMILPVNQMNRIESYKKGVAIYIQNKSEPVIVRSSFTAVAEVLDASVFICISRGLAVNMEYIERISHGVCYFVDGTSALLSRKDRNEIQSAYNYYLFEKVKSFKGV